MHCTRIMKETGQKPLLSKLHPSVIPDIVFAAQLSGLVKEQNDSQ